MHPTKVFRNGKWLWSRDNLKFWLLIAPERQMPCTLMYQKCFGDSPSMMPSKIFRKGQMTP